MGISEKRIKRQEEVRALILNAAKKLFVGKGYANTSIRKIAAEIGYSPTTIYLYYQDKNDIIHALHQEGFGMLGLQFNSLATVESPMERLKALGRTYIRFAMEYADYYKVMFMMDEPMAFLNSESHEKCWEEGNQVFGFLVKTIADCQEAGYFPGAHPGYFALQAWSVVHGLCSLYLTSRLAKIGDDMFSNETEESLLENSYKSYVNFLEQLQK